MSNDKQTAVEWLVKELNQKIDFIPLEKWDMIRDIIQQAKEMEKEQMMDFALEYMMQSKPVVDYYNETYGAKK
jgi:adenylate kinase family enzyme